MACRKALDRASQPWQGNIFARINVWMAQNRNAEMGVALEYVLIKTAPCSTPFFFCFVESFSSFSFFSKHIQINIDVFKSLEPLSWFVKFLFFIYFSFFFSFRHTSNSTWVPISLRRSPTWTPLQIPSMCINGLQHIEIMNHHHHHYYLLYQSTMVHWISSYSPAVHVVTFNIECLVLNNACLLACLWAGTGGFSQAWYVANTACHYKDHCIRILIGTSTWAMKLKLA